MMRYQNYTRLDNSAAPAPAAEVTVYLAGTLTKATIYSDDGVTVKANPFTSSASTPFAGYFDFYAENGDYDIRFSGGGIVIPYTWGDVQLFDGVAYLNWKNVRDYGAQGDGSTDDLAAFDAATVAAGAGGVVYIPDANANKFYNLGTGWIIDGYKGIRVIFQSPAAVIAATATSSTAYAMSLYNSSAAIIDNPSFGGVAGGGGAIQIGKSDNTKPSFDVVINNPIVPPNFDQDAIKVWHGMGLVVYRILGSSDVGRWCTDAALNGGIYGPNSATITAKCVMLPQQPSGQNNICRFISPHITGYRGHGIYAIGVDTLIVDGGAVEANARNWSLLTRPAQISAYLSGRVNITSVYTETLVATADNIWLDTCPDSTVTGCVFGSDSPTTGGIRFKNMARSEIKSCFGEYVYIDANCTDCLVDDLGYGGNGGTFTDLGKNTRRSRLVNISSASSHVAGQQVDLPMNLTSNVNFSQWNSASSPVGWDISNCTATRTGVGEVDTTTFAGRFAMRLDTRTNVTNGARFIIPAYSDAVLRPEMVGQQVTVGFWMKVTAGPSPVVSGYYDNGAFTSDVSSVYDTASGGWQKVGGSFNVLTGYTLLDVRVSLPDNASVVYLGGVEVTYGEAMTPFVTNRLIQGGDYGYTVVGSSATPAFDSTSASMQLITLTADVTAVTLPNPIPGKPLVLQFVQNGTGGWTVTGWPASVKWSGGVAPVMSAAANAISTVTLVYNGTNWMELSRVLGY